MRSWGLHLDVAGQNDELLRGEGVVLLGGCGDVNDGTGMQVVGFAHDDFRLIVPMERGALGCSQVKIVGLFVQDYSSQYSVAVRIGDLLDKFCRVDWAEMRKDLFV